ncbi:hypothetical protein DH2020_011649 [Rehmannia glutinosa]|uniref:RNase H type-1 domain-containing protein n=1 Tax=Rehmannia glutinosa TaxID=99300 RepID=A0ABR0XE30_REHGL
MFLFFLGLNSIHRKPAAFRFQKMWIRHHSFLDTIRDVWDAPTGTQGMPNLHHKLIRVKQRLTWWNWNIFGNIFSKLHEAEQKVASCEQLFDSQPSPELHLNLKKAIAELTLATKIHEDFWHQKSACKWLVEGERNTRYFHNLVKQKRLKGRIHSILDNGNTLTEEEDIIKSAAAYFQNILSDDGTCSPFMSDFSIPSIPEHVDLSHLCDLSSHSEIKSAIFSLNAEGVAGPDGFSAIFYQKCWDIVGKDVCAAVLDFFSGNPMPKAFTATTLVVDSFSAELAALEFGMQILLQKDISKIIIEIDSSLLFHAISQSEGGHWRSLHILTRIRSMLSQLEVQFSHTLREGNIVADAVAHLACQSTQNRVILPQDIPRNIVRLARMDQLGIPSFRRKSVLCNSVRF